MMRYFYPKSIRLHSQKKIDALYAEKEEQFIVFPLRFVAKRIQDPTLSSPILFLPVAPKKRFTKAVQRNQIKRHLRESFRLNLHRVTLKSPWAWHLAVSYVGPAPSQWLKTEQAMIKGLEKLNIASNENHFPKI